MSGQPKPWEPGYKPPTATQAFDPSQPLPQSALDALDYINRKDDALEAAEARIADLEAALHTIASRTWNIQYEAGVAPQTARFAGGIHTIARTAVEPPAD